MEHRKYWFLLQQLGSINRCRMSNNSLALTSSRNWRAGNEYGSSSDEEPHQSRQSGVPWPLYHRSEGGSMYAPWRSFEERVRTGPYGLTRFPLQPYSPVRILVLEGGTNERVNPRLRQFIRDASPPRIRGDWHLARAPEPEQRGLTDEEFNEAMQKLRKQVYSPPYPRKRAYKRSFFSSKRNNTSNDAAGDEANDQEQCTICLDEFLPNDRLLVTPCGHTFHSDCLVPWVKRTGQCPVCRFAFCERRGSRELSRNNSSYRNNNSYSNTAGFDEDDHLAVDVISLIRAMEEAFNWIRLSR